MRDVVSTEEPHQNLRPWSPAVDEHGHFVLEAMNRYFTHHKAAGEQTSVPLNKQIDPRGVLAKIGLQEDLVHLTDNQVLYFEKTSAPNQ
jgi:hypothetical protein